MLRTGSIIIVLPNWLSMHLTAKYLRMARKSSFETCHEVVRTRAGLHTMYDKRNRILLYESRALIIFRRFIIHNCDSISPEVK